jgi:hypothetical protein
MIIGDRILEPVFLNCNFDGTTYLTLLLEDLMPGLAALFSNPLDPHLLHERYGINTWREKRLEMALIQISVPARENYRVIKGF